MKKVIAGLSLMLFGPLIHAEAWLDAGDTALRHDLQLLADAGVIRLPLSAWPIPSIDVARVLAQVSDREVLSASDRAALQRLERRMAVLKRDSFRTNARFSAASDPARLRTFENTPREEAEISGSVSASTRYVSARLRVTAVADPDDEQRHRLDGSYVTARLGNWLFTAGAQERWWGPGWDGSVLLSSNARPLPALSIDRETSEPFKPRWLSWLGPWRLSAFMGRMEGERQDRDHPLLFGMRVVAQPVQGLEIALERTIQWCGEGLPCSPQAFWNAFSGHDNVGENIAAAEEPGNQLAGWSARWASPIGDAPYALYAQHTGETIDNRIPIRPLRSLELVGVEVWGGSGTGASWRVNAEFAGTACGEFDSAPAPFFDCGYENGIFNVEGYRYRGRPLGHAMDSDGRLYSLGFHFTSASAWSASVRLRTGELNRGGAVPDLRHTLASEPTDIWDLDTVVRIPFQRFDLELGAGLERATTASNERTDQSARAFLQWRQRL